MAKVDGDMADILRRQQPRADVRSGDWVVTDACMKRMGNDILNETYRLTR